MRPRFAALIFFVILLLICVILATEQVAAQMERPPNFLILLADDMGFSDLGCYGGEIATPHLDRLAANGLRFTQFYNTGRCWPTRAAILTGYYAQQVRMDPPQGQLPQWARLLPHYLKPLGYRAYHSGKWHVAGAPKPVADGGFDRSYFISDYDRHFYPRKHARNDEPLSQAEPESDYYSTTAIADEALRCLQEHAEQHREKPFFQYVAFLAPHFPLHAPAEDIARYRDRYLEGWDVIRRRRAARAAELGITNCTPRELDSTLRTRYFKPEFLTELGPREVDYAVPWDTLTDEQQRFQATKMAIHAAMVDRLDQEIGRLLDQLRAMDAYENTVVLFLSDNGADATILVRGDGHNPAAEPGSGESYLCLGPGWASASNSPFHRHKIWVHEGGIATPLIVHWPTGIRARGELRHTMGHVIDLVPTILELAGAKPEPTWNGAAAPDVPGKSLIPLFAEDGTVEREFLFFHHQGNRALRMGDWKIVSATEDGDAWQLYNLANDRGETIDLAARYPDRVETMEARWNELEAEYRRVAESR